MFKRLIRLLLISLIIFLVVINYGKIKAYADRWLYFSFCDTPISFKVGTIDPRFNVGLSEIIEDTKMSAAVWNGIIGKELFYYDDNSELDINLVYDERQKTLQKIDVTKSQVEDQKKNLSGNINNYEKEKAELESKIEELNKEIESWNKKGGAPKKVYDELKARQASLQKQIEALNKTAENLNKTSEKINQTISTVNKNVNEFNDILHIKPEEGLYITSPLKIEIYIYESENGFINTVAHELGHALGLAHITQQDAIMSPVSSPDTHITETDINSIKDYCTQQNRLVLIKNDLKLLAYNFLAKIENIDNINE